jgi:hypothetical protein
VPSGKVRSPHRHHTCTAPFSLAGSLRTSCPHSGHVKSTRRVPTQDRLPGISVSAGVGCLVITLAGVLPGRPAALSGGIHGRMIHALLDFLCTVLLPSCNSGSIAGRLSGPRSTFALSRSLIEDTQNSLFPRRRPRCRIETPLILFSAKRRNNRLLRMPKYSSTPEASRNSGVRGLATMIGSIVNSVDFMVIV